MSRHVVIFVRIIPIPRPQKEQHNYEYISVEFESYGREIFSEMGRQFYDGGTSYVQMT